MIETKSQKYQMQWDQNKLLPAMFITSSVSQVGKGLTRCDFERLAVNVNDWTSMLAASLICYIFHNDIRRVEERKVLVLWLTHLDSLSSFIQVSFQSPAIYLFDIFLK